MKIGFVFDDSLDRHDGVQQYVTTLGRWLTEQDHEVHYLVGETKRQDLPNVHSLTQNRTASGNKNRLSIPRWFVNHKNIEQLLDQLSLDVLHVQLPYHPFMSGQVIKAASPNTAVVGTFHIMPSSLLINYATKLLSMVERGGLKRFDMVVAASKPAKMFSEQYYTHIDEVVPNTVDIAAFSQPYRNKTAGKKIVFLGRLVERKGCQHLIQAAEMLGKRSDSPPFSVEIGGTGPLEKTLRHSVSQTGLNGKISFRGFIDEPAKPGFLNQADIAVFPATGGESFGIILIEAMAAGAGVVIGGNNPGYRSVLGDINGVLFDPTDTQAFSDLLYKLLTDQSTSRRIHIEQQKRVEKFDVSVVGQHLLGLYTAAIAKRLQKHDN